jgi:hypothetical protein
MNTKLVMTATAVTLGILGVGLTFVPDEVANLIELQSNSTTIIIFQLLGALYFSFAMINWSIRDGRIGGIYNRPIALGNFTHFLIGALALIKAIFDNQNLGILFWALCVVYSIFAILHWYITFTNPLKNKEQYQIVKPTQNPQI